MLYASCLPRAVRWAISRSRETDTEGSRLGTSNVFIPERDRAICVPIYHLLYSTYNTRVLFVILILILVVVVIVVVV